MSLPTLTVVTVAVTAAITLAIAIADFVPAQFVLANSAQVGVPSSWLVPLGAAKLAGCVGLLAGLAGFTAVGIAAAVGLVAFFVGAVVAHVRAAVFYNIGFPVVYLLASTASLVMLLA